MSVYDNHRLLELTGISKTFTGIQALNRVDFDLASGEVHALVGENGAGKSTLVKLVAGIEKVDVGTIRLNGQSIVIRNPQHARDLGIGAIFQELSQIPFLTVAENVFLGHEAKRAGMLLDRDTMVQRTQRVLNRYGIDLDPHAEVASLSAAQRQLSEIVKALCLQPKILIMDEPTSALTAGETEIVFRIIEDLKRAGIGILYVSHRMDEVFHVADRVAVLRDGELVADRRAAELDLPKVVELMVGREVELYESESKRTRPNGRVRLEVKRLARNGAFSDVSFQLHEGEILGIAGLVGSGRSELARAIFGVDRIDAGEILLDGKPRVIDSPRAAMELGLALLPESRHVEGLVLSHSVASNMTLPILSRLQSMGFVSLRRADELINGKLAELDIKPRDAQRIIKYLSGGNQQKVVVAKWLLTEPRVLIVDEPTAGIDVHSKSEIHRLLRLLAGANVSIIMISSEMPELLAHSDRIMVMNQGRVLGVFQETNQETIMSLIMQDMLTSRQKEEN